jgi:ATP-binding cassette subfamily F protein 3
VTPVSEEVVKKEKAQITIFTPDFELSGKGVLLISLTNIEKQFGTRILYNGVTASLNPDRRTALIGSNGAGKTILLKILVGEESVDKGSVTVPEQLRIGYLPQEMIFQDECAALPFTLQPFRHLLESESLFEQLATAEGNEYEKVSERIDTLLVQSRISDAYALPARARSILTGLGVGEELWQTPLTALSGGYRMRVFLARLLLLEPDLLLLDEPTNHLDMASLIWLEKFLQRFSGGLCVVSHDRDFLRRITDTTAELVNGALTVFNGTIDVYFAWKEQKELTERRREQNIQEQISQAEQFIRRFKATATKASQARSKGRQLERLQQQLPHSVSTAGTITLHLPQHARRSGAVPLSLHRVHAAYNDTAAVFTDVSLTINRGNKIAILGSNGAGKSTLLKLCAGIVKPKAGKIVRGYNTEIRYFSQHRLEQLDGSRSCFDTVADAVGRGRSRTEVQTILGAFLFSGDEVEKKVEVLSGGEKSRLSLAVILADPGNVLLLDEPTNHLDIESVERLAVALDEFEGTMMVVSHDEDFIRRFANRIIELDRGTVRDVPGTLDDYRYSIENLFPLQEGSEHRGVPREKETNAGDERKRLRKRKRQKKKRLEHRIEKLERQITETEEQIGELEKALNNPENATDFTLLQDTTEKLTRYRLSCESLFAQWETVSEERRLLEKE